MKLTTMLLAAAIAAGPCLAQSINGPLSFTVTVHGNSSCTFQGISYTTQVTQTMSNEWAAHTSLSDMLVTKYPDSCSALLRQFTAYGLPLTSVVISVQANINNSVRELKRLTLGSPIITSISTTGTTETIKLSFPSVKTRWYDGIEESHSKN